MADEELSTYEQFKRKSLKNRFMLWWECLKLRISEWINAHSF